MKPWPKAHPPTLADARAVAAPFRNAASDAAESGAQTPANRPPTAKDCPAKRARQAGKNETAAHIEALLLNLYRRRGGYLVKASPTFRPQTLNSIQRLQGLLNDSLVGEPAFERGYILRLDRARAAFYSAGVQSSVVGATANILLQADEAQDINAPKWNKDFRPMGASTNVTTVLWGTAWTSYTLLATTIKALRWQQAKDGIQRVFETNWEQVAKEVPAYGQYVRTEIARLGIHHPLIQSQYLLQEIDAEGGMFTDATQSLMKGTHLRQRAPTPGRQYAILVDVAGASEDRKAGALLRQQQPRKDSTALTIIEVAHLPMGMARFLVMNRYYWTGTPHADLYSAILQPPKAISAGPSWASPTLAASQTTETTDPQNAANSGQRSPPPTMK